MADGTEQNPLTREDVLKKIEENGGTAEGLDLSGKVFEKGIDLQGLNLEGIILRDAHLEGATLSLAHLEGAVLFGAHLEGAVLFGAHLEGAVLCVAHLEGAVLAGAEFSSDTRLDNIDWGNFILEEEKGNFFKEEKPSSFSFRIAADTYRRLKMWYTNAGVYDIAAKFYYREMEAKRKAQSWKSEPISKLWLWVIKLLCGYGEKPWRVVVWGISVLFGSALLYFFLRGVAPHTLTLQAFLASLYYSAVSFTALGYGPWFSASSVRSWVQGVGAAEAIIGVFTIALFLVTFVRKMTR